jgi:hypothetical protein
MAPMRMQRLLACTFLVLLAHGALVVMLARHGPKQVLVPRVEVRNTGRLVLLGRGEVAALAMPRVADTLIPAPHQDPVEPQTQERVAGAGAGATDPAVPRGVHDSGSSLVRTGLTAYRSQAELDGPVRARSAPDLTMLANLPWSGLPIHLRLFIDRRGVVVDTQVLKSNEADEVVAQVRQMFLATGFTPGLVHAEPVPSYKDIEIAVDNPT